MRGAKRLRGRPKMVLASPVQSTPPEEPPEASPEFSEEEAGTKSGKRNTESIKNDSIDEEKKEEPEPRRLWVDVISDN